MKIQSAINELCNGVASWNSMRAESNGIIDLTHIEIRNAILEGANFDGVNFDGSRFINVSFKYSSFKKAKLNGVTASKVNFNHAVFSGAELKGTDLSKCNLENAKLIDVLCYHWKVRHSSFKKSQLKPAQFDYCHFYNADLSESEFNFPMSTNSNVKRLVMTREQEDELTVRGICSELLGSPNKEEWINWELEKMQPEDSEFGLIILGSRAHWITESRWDVFLSHSSKQKIEIVQPLLEQLSDAGLRVWYDQKEIEASDSLSERINFGLKACPFGVLVISQDYLASTWTNYELKALTDKRIIIVLFDMTLEDITNHYPVLADKLMLPVGMGSKSLATHIVSAVRRLPHELVT